MPAMCEHEFQFSSLFPPESNISLYRMQQMPPHSHNNLHFPSTFIYPAHSQQHIQKDGSTAVSWLRLSSPRCHCSSHNKALQLTVSDAAKRTQRLSVREKRCSSSCINGKIIFTHASVRHALHCHYVTNRLPCCAVIRACAHPPRLHKPTNGWRMSAYCLFTLTKRFCWRIRIRIWLMLFACAFMYFFFRFAAAFWRVLMNFKRRQRVQAKFICANK